MPRVITALVGIPLLVLFIGWGRPWHFSVLVFSITAGGLWEYFSMAFPAGGLERCLGVIFGVLLSLGILIPGFPEPGLWLGIVTSAAFSAYLFLGKELEERFKILGWSLAGAVYIGYLVPHWVILYRLPEGKSWVFFLLLVVMAGDTAAYFVGTSFGRKKLWPEVSPGKTIEGALGFLGGSVIAGVLGGRFLLPAISGVETLFLALVASVLGQIGDLFESWLKRVFCVKDSGFLLPGHGGVLDRIDSLIFPVVFTSYYLRLIHS